jgi:hypothetical protein
MTMPKEILDIFEKETKDLQFGKVSISLVLRGGHYYYEVDKHFTVMVDKEPEINPIKGEENG